jgi:hypothetical protein
LGAIGWFAVTTQPFSFRQRLKEISRFFQKRDEVHKTMYRLVQRLKKAGIPHAAMGGMAVNAHHHERTTKDVDVLLTVAGFDEFRQRFVPKYYENLPGRTRRFVDKLNNKGVDILITGHYPGSGKRGPIAFPDPQEVKEIIDNIDVVDLVTLIQLKLAARRHQDFADVVNLIKVNDLDESFQHQLHRSVRRDYIECLEEKRREDEYEERNG